MTTTELRTSTRKELAAKAKHYRVIGWHSMKKQELIEALLSVFAARKSRSRKRNAVKPLSANSRKSSSKPPANGKQSGRRRRAAGAGGNGRSSAKSKRRPGSKASARTSLPRLKPSAGNGSTNSPLSDQLIAEACDPYWIHVSWILTPRMIQRAEVALGVEWHQAVPVIRVLEVTNHDSGTASETLVCDIEVHGHVDHWYVPVDNPPREYKLHIGYLTPRGHFFALARSNRVITPRPRNVGKAVNGRSNSDHSKNGLSNLQLRKYVKARAASISNPSGNRNSADGFRFSVNTELIIHGTTHPDAELTLLGEPVPLGEDGSFSLRFSLPNGRQVIPAVAITPNGAEQRTIVLGIERNTKELEPRLVEDLLT